MDMGRRLAQCPAVTLVAAMEIVGYDETPMPVKLAHAKYTPQELKDLRGETGARQQLVDRKGAASELTALHSGPLRQYAKPQEEQQVFKLLQT